MIAEVIIQSNVKNLNKTFDYKLPEEYEKNALELIGARVLVPFGRMKTLEEGYIVNIKEETEYEVVIQSDVISYIPYKTIYENDSSLEEGKEVVEQSGYKGCKSETYKILKLNGKTVSKTLLSKDTYDAMDRIIKRGTKNETETNATEENSKNEIQKENDIEE